MNIKGLAKVTLLDYPGKVACTVFTGGCNFRCPFCHNSLLVLPEHLIYGDGTENVAEEDFFSYLDKRKGILDGVCITGGEPLLQNGIEKFISAIKERGFCVKLDTNGSFPDKLINLVNKKLIDYVAMDIKNTFDKYGMTVGVDNYDTAPIKSSIDFLKENNIDYEFRTTVVREFHDVNDMEQIGRMLQGASKYYIQEFVDSGNLICEGLHGIPLDEMQDMAEILKRYIDKVEIRGE
ncbi:MAG: anaerobic ribonucleoside-triphosphate reductase activating protein [Eubacterium sp.]